MEKSKRKRLSTLLIILGILVILVPIVGKLYIDHQQEVMYQEYLEQMAAEQGMLDLYDTFNSEDGVTEVAPSKPNSAKADVIGKISIPDIDVDLILVEGTASKDLSWGAGHVTGTAMPGALGNCAIAGHRNYTFGSYFSRLEEVATGGAVSVEYNGTTYNYTITDIFVVTPDDTSVLTQGDKKEGLLTLITCHPKGTNTHRLIVRGKLND